MKILTGIGEFASNRINLFIPLVFGLMIGYASCMYDNVMMLPLYILFFLVYLFLKDKRFINNFYQYLFYTFLALVSLLGFDFAYKDLFFNYVNPVIIVMFLFIAVFIINREYRHFKLPKPFFILYSLFLLYGFAQLLRVEKDTFLNTAIRSLLVFYSIFILIAMNTIKDKYDFKLLAKFYYIIALVNPVITAVRIIGNEFNNGFRFFSTNRVLGAIILLFGIIFYEHFKNRKLLITIVALNLFCSIAQGYRSVWIGIIAALIVLSIFKIKYPDLIKINLKITIALIVISIPLIFVAVSLRNGSYTDGIEYLKYRMNVSSEGTAIDRMVFWNISYIKFKSSPLTGIGFDTDIIEYGSIHGIPTTDPHNSLLGLLVRLGIAGMTIFIAIVVYVYICAFRIIRRDGDRYIRQATLFCLVLNIFMLFFSFFNATLELGYDGIFFWIPMGVIMNFYMKQGWVNVKCTEKYREGINYN